MSESVSVASPASPRRRLNQVAVAIAALLCIGAAAAGATRYLLSTNILDNAVVAQIRRTTGLSTMVGGHARFSLFPQPRIDLDDVAISEPAGAIRIHVPKLSAYLRILPLFGGRMEIGRATLYQPDISIAFGRTPILMQSAVTRLAEPTSTARELPLGRIDIVDGHARLEQGLDHTTDFRAINLSLNWPSAYASAAVSGEVTLRGTPISIDAWLSQPIELMRGGQSATMLRLGSDALTFWTSGRISAVPRIRYAGQISAQAASLRKLAQIGGFSFPRHGAFAEFELRGDLDYKRDTATLANLQMSLDGNDYEGSLAVQYQAGIPRFSGTLASNLLNVSPFLLGSKADAGSWKRHALDLSDLRFADLDLRISASRLRLNDMELEDAALSLMTKPGHLELALAEATANQGTVRGRLSLSARAHDLALHVIGSGKNIDLEPMALGIKRALSGSLDASLALDSTGADLNRLVQGLAGRVEILVSNGELKGIDIAATLRQAGAKTVGEPIASVDGATSFDKLGFGLRLAGGIGQIEQGQFSANGAQLNFAGEADMRRRTLDIAAVGGATGNPPATSIPLKLRVKGGWDDFRFFEAEPDLHLPPAPAHTGDLPDDATSYAPPE